MKSLSSDLGSGEGCMEDREVRSFYGDLFSARLCAGRFAYALPFATPKVPLVIILTIMIFINNSNPLAHTEPPWLELKVLSQLILKTASGSEWLSDLTNIENKQKMSLLHLHLSPLLSNLELYLGGFASYSP